jgi:glycerol uptake facilitator-like aquaporin
MAAHLMFEQPLFFASQHLRSSGAEVFSEAVATFGLLLVIFGAVRNAGTQVPLAVAGYIVAAYWFTASTSFANPAVTLARSMTDTFAGIAPASVPGFLLGQAVGATAAILLVRGWERRDG